MAVLMRFIFMIPALFHFVGILLLYNIRSLASHKTHFWHLTTLAISEMIYSITLTVRYLFTENLTVLYTIIIVSDAGVLIFIDLIMQLILLDRFLEIFLNIRYPVYWSVKKTNICILVCILLSIVPVLILILLYWLDLPTVFGVLAVYLYPFICFAFLLTSLLTYGYIIKNILHHLKNTNRVHSTVSRESNSVVEQRMRRRLRNSMILPTLLIVTYLAFRVSPSLLYFYRGLKRHFPTPIEIMIAQLLMFTALVSDALIYLFTYKPIHKFLRRVRDRQLNASSIISRWETHYQSFSSLFQVMHVFQQ